MPLHLLPAYTDTSSHEGRMKRASTRSTGGKPSEVSASVSKIDDVAQAAGVSPSTVSRVLNGTAVVSETKRKAIFEAIRVLGYVPNPVARGLAGGRTLSIGVITPAIDSPFFGTALRGIQDRLEPPGYTALVVNGQWDKAIETRCVDLLLARRVDGIIALSSRMSGKALKVRAGAIPLVGTGRALKAPGLFSLDFNDFEGARLATQHLIQIGHRSIAFINGDPHHADSRQRLQGYRSALQDAGIGPDERLVLPGAFQEADGLAAIHTLSERQCAFTAVFAGNDQMAFGAILGLQQIGLRVPDDVSVVGFDDLPTAMYSIPPLTTVRHPAYDIGQLAATAMLQLLSGELPRVTAPAPEMVMRQSTRPAAT